LWITPVQEAIFAVPVVPPVDDELEDDEPESFDDEEEDDDDEDDEDDEESADLLSEDLLSFDEADDEADAFASERLSVR